VNSQNLASLETWTLSIYSADEAVTGLTEWISTNLKDDVLGRFDASRS
jgi:hypothetical protein